MSNCNMCIHRELCVSFCTVLMDAVQRRAVCPKYIDRTKIIEKPCSRVYYISGKGTSYATVMSKAVEDLYLFELEDLKNSGYFIDYTDAQMALNRIMV